MTGTVHSLNLENSTAREHITLPIEQLAELLSNAETLGGYRALSDRDSPERVNYLCEQAVTHQWRKNLWAALIRAPGRAKA